MIILQNRKWDEQNLLAEAFKYNLVSEFRENSSGAYQKSKKLCI